jgi:lactose/cellobiose-specific phosphotransferase system IIC component
MIISRLKLFIDVLRASFVSLIPYYVFYSILLLIITIIKYFSFNFFIPLDDIIAMTVLIGGLFPILINLSISYHLSIMYKTDINKIILMILNLLVFLSAEFLINDNSLDRFELSKYTFLAILVPIVTYPLLDFYINKFQKLHNGIYTRLSKSVSTSFMYITPFIFIFIFVVPILYLLIRNFNFDFGISAINHEMTEVLLFIRMIFSHIFWFIGIHGANFFDTIVNFKFLNDFLAPNLTAKEFYDLFVIFGGSGCGLSLVIAIFIASRDKHMNFIGKLSFPFVIFNINEILIFGIPMFLNFKLIIPFILVPIINFFIAYIVVVEFELISFLSINIPWTTPALVNMYIITDGNFYAIFFQIFLIFLGTLIYMPFIKRYSELQSSSYTLEKMNDKLDLSLEVESSTDIKFREAQSDLINSHYKVAEVVDFINQNNLFIYYQPKIDVKNKICNDFESLIRVRNKEGKIIGPYFMQDIEDSGLASLIDMWVCKEVRKDLDRWKTQGFEPNIAINIFPYTLEDKEYIKRIIELFEGYNITIEIIERRSALSSEIISNLKYLKSKGFKISLDDMGAGYTNFEVLYKLPLDSVKIDKSVIDFTSTKKGYVLYESICMLSTQLEYEIILEGIETKEQLERLMNKDVSLVQGWVYSKALPFEEVIPYKEAYESKA